jgi:hypothetical protein
MARYAYDADDGSAVPFDQCPDCRDRDPHHRARHQLDLARVGGLDTLRGHLTEQYVRLRDREKQRPDLVDDVCHWVATLIEQYSHFPDDTTGQLMPWWQARQILAQARERIARQAYASAPEAYRRKAEGREVAGFTRVGQAEAHVPPATPFPPEAPWQGPTRIRELDELDASEVDNDYRDDEGA